MCIRDRYKRGLFLLEGGFLTVKQPYNTTIYNTALYLSCLLYTSQAAPGGSDTAAAGAERRRYRTAPERAATGSTEKETRDGAMT